MNKNITNGNEDFHESMKINLDSTYRIKYIKYNIQEWTMFMKNNRKNYIKFIG